MSLVFNLAEIVLTITMITTFIVSLIYCKTKRFLLPIQLYIFVSLINGALLTTMSHYINNELYIKLGCAEINIFSLFELSLFYYYLYKIILVSLYRIIMIVIYVSFTLVSLYTWTVMPNGFYAYLPTLYGLENLLIIIPALFYAYESLKSDLEIDFSKDPHFIIVCGILFYFGLTMPIFLLNGILNVVAPSFASLYKGINEFLLAILFISFFKAYLCPLPERKLF
jgi:hypothetical protein